MQVNHLDQPLKKDEFEKLYKQATSIIDLRLYQDGQKVNFLSDDAGMMNLFEKHPQLIDGVILYLSHFQHRIYSHREFLALQEISKKEGAKK